MYEVYGEILRRYAHVYTLSKKIITSYIKDTTVSVNSYIFGQSTKAISLAKKRPSVYAGGDEETN